RRIGDGRSLSGQLLGFTHRNKPGIQTIGKSRTKDESAGLDAKNQIDILLHVVRRERIDESCEPDSVLQQGCNVVEQNAWFGKVWNLADKVFEMIAIDCIRLRL